MKTFDDYKNEVSSEKITLAILEAAKRLIAFSVHSGSVYKIESFSIASISTIKDSGVELTEVGSLAAVIAGTFYNDRENSILYLETADSGDPNSKFVHMVFKLFFSSVPVTLPHDLNTGTDVFWEPLIAGTSDFGVELDTVNQQNETIEGSGSINLFNDQEFWPANFDRLFFENQNCRIYSWNRDLEPSEAKLLFRGKVDSKNYSSKSITIKLKDLMAQLRNPVALSEIQELGLRNPPNLDKAKQRMVFGRVFGHRLTNLDAVINSRYPLTGTVAVTFNSATVTGTGTSFLTQVSPDDKIDFFGVEYTVASVTNNGSLTLTEVYASTSASGLSVDIIPNNPKRWHNRVWKIAGHALREPVATIQVGSSTTQLFLDSTEDMFDGDFIYVGTLGSGELVTINKVVNGKQVTLATSLPSNPTTGTTVLRPCVQQVKIDDTELVFYRDYTVNAATATLTLRSTAEVNAGAVRQALDQATFTNGSNSVTGVGTNFKSFLKDGYVIRPFASTDLFEILTVVSDTQVLLRTNFTGATATNYVQYKSLIFDPSENVLHCEALGRTDDGTTSGSMLRKAPEMVMKLLSEAGFLDREINEESFTNSQHLLDEDLSFVVPQKYDDTSSVTYRDVMNRINKSVFGILFQDNDFKMSYDVLRPVVPVSPIVIKESDCLSWSVASTNKNMIKRALVEYGYREYDTRVKQSSIATVENTSDIANFILGTSKERTFSSVLVNEQDAQRLCNRWKFLLEFSTNTVRISTKLQLIDAEINDIVDFEHRKFYQRFAGTSKRKFLAIEKITKTGTGVDIECVDLSNAFNRIALITDSTQPWSNSSEEIRIRAGFITDENGLIDNSESSFGTNLIW